MYRVYDEAKQTVYLSGDVIFDEADLKSSETQNYGNLDELIDSIEPGNLENTNPDADDDDEDTEL